ncbi:F-box protein At3g07870-like [Salvia miltiorrhiza]|uniref:F-box protein At3g07870-like n=1 Tax=Salvia miltiorrhiza TaxID=226208 RepID=UPI0025AD6F03|nr:F-box protein At3g07870-like [Salvia miltiorrhiza]
MKQLDLFTNLPSHIIIDILSRLPIATIIRCKFVCKPWLHLLQSHEFVAHHLSTSAPALAVTHHDYTSSSSQIIFYEFQDDHLHLEHHHLHYNPLITINFELPYNKITQGSVNGFLFLRDLNVRPNALYICNPITREYTKIHTPQEFNYTYPQVVTFGFGSSRVSSQHKVVRVFHECIRDQDTYKVLAIPKSECHVYTLGAGSWRSVLPPSAPMLHSCRSIGAFLNGNLHWLVFDLDYKPMISCFDLETELFSTFSAPQIHRGRFLVDVFALGDCLCVCDNSSDDEIVVWLMKEYGVDKSWTKEYVINKTGDLSGECYEVVRPIKVFKDGDVLMAWGEFSLCYYSNKMKNINMFAGDVDSILHTPTFLSLRSFGMENVSSF